MPSLFFANPGLIDLDSSLLLGVNAKLKDDAIGLFGTGLKYAIAVLLRTGHGVEVWRGNQHFQYTSKTKITRNTEYQQVCQNEIGLGFTTDLGKNWEVWMAMRELWSNCQDEGGYVSTDFIAPSENQTIVKITGSEIMKAWANRYKL